MILWRDATLKAAYKLALVSGHRFSDAISGRYAVPLGAAVAIFDFVSSLLGDGSFMMR
jgi:hypothetical protein